MGWAFMDLFVEYVPGISPKSLQTILTIVNVWLAAYLQWKNTLKTFMVYAIFFMAGI